MNNNPIIAIFSGSVPSSVFVERLINGVAKYYQVSLFGVVNEPIQYESKNIKIYRTPQSHGANFYFTCIRCFKLIFKRPKHLRIIYQEVQRYPTLYERWIWFSKFIPLATYPPDILHLQWARDLDFYYFFKERLGFKMVLSLRGAHINYTPIVEPEIARLYKSSFINLDGFHAVSKTIAFEAEKYGLDPSKVKVIHSPIPGSLLEKTEPSLLVKKGSFKIISIGRYHWVKGVKYTLDALNILKEQKFQFEFHYISSNEIDQETLFQIKQLGLDEHFYSYTNLAQEAVFDLISDSDVLVLSSLAEGIANVVLEAMVLGTPVISTNCGGMHEVVKSGETGWLVPNRNSKALADAINAVFEMPKSDKEIIVKNAYNFIRLNFHEDKIMSQFLNFYENIIRE